MQKSFSVGNKTFMLDQDKAEAAFAAKAKRPDACLELARLRSSEALAAPGSDGRLTAAQTAGIIGPLVFLILPPIAVARMCASVVFPSPGGPLKRIWSSTSSRCLAASTISSRR